MNFLVQQLKNVALFLLGVFLIVFGFRANAPVPEPETRQKKEPPSSPDTKVLPKNQKTTLEKAAPEKASGSR